MKKLLLAFILAAAPLCVFAQLPSYLPTDGLVGWWPFNGNANDESGNNNNGTINGATLTSDRFGNLNSAYDFNGNSYIFSNQVNNLPLGNNSRAFCLWMKTNVTSSPPNKDMFNWGSATTTSQRFGFTMYSGLPYFVAQNDDFYGNTPIGNNNWHFIVINYDGNLVSIFVDGLLDASQSKNLNTVVNDLIFGRSPLNHPSPTYYTGTLDDIGIWNRVLTQQEITALYISDPSGSGNTATSNVPAGISYQAVARNAQGQPLSDAAVQVKFTLITDSLTGAAEYSESHSLTTNSLGLFATAFGSGTPETETFADINWASGSKYLKVELDAGDGFVDIGTQQLLSVPFSMRSNTSAKAGTIENAGLPVYADNAAALAGGLIAGQMYRTATGDLKIVY